MRIALGFLSLVVLLMAGFNGVCQAAPRDDAQRLFDLVEAAAPKGKSRLAIQQELTKAAPADDADYRVRLAYAYALIREKKYPDALAVVTAVAAQEPNSLSARQAKAWLLFVSRKPTEALVELDAIAKAMSTAGASQPGEDECFEAAQFLGTALAYCEGPGAALLKKPAVVQTKSRVLKQLRTDQRAAFDEQAAAVAAQFAELQGKGREVAEEAQAKKDEADKAAAEKQAEVDKAAAAAKAESDKVAEKLKKKYDELTGEYGRLSESYNRLLAEMAAARTGLANATVQLGSLRRPQRDRNGQVSSADQNAYDRQANRLQGSINNLNTNIARLATSLEQASARGKQIENQVAQLNSDGQKVGAHFAEIKNTLDKKKAKAAKQKSAANKLPVHKPAALGEREKAFVTYADFPYETAKQRLLDTFGE